MTAPQRFLAQIDNALVTATLAPSAVRASAAQRARPAVRTGTGRVALSGAYTGAESATLDLRVVAGGKPQASAPAFAGVGNGALSVLAVDAAAPQQTLTFTLSSTGTRTTPAMLELGAVRLVAKLSGAAGNAVTITVTPELSTTPMAFSTLADWPAGQATQPGAQWDGLGGAPLKSDGSLDTALCPRVRFGDLPTVYRVYQVYKDGQWQTGLSPAPAAVIPKGVSAYTVSGSYTVTITDGNTTETQTGVVSLYDWLLALASSALVRVDGPVTQDQRPGGMDAVDLPLRTAAWPQSMQGSIAPDNLRIGATSPTQTVTVQCVDATLPGAEVWSVTGSLSGRLPDATTGAAYASDVVSFTLPLPQQVSGGQSSTAQTLAAASWNVLLTDRKDTEAEPIVCARVAAGSRAAARSVTFTYRKRPPKANCPCPALPQLSSACLSQPVSSSTGGTMATLDPAYQTRLRSLYGWREGLAKANTAYVEAVAPTPPIPGIPGTPATPPTYGPETYGFGVLIDGVIGVDFDGYATPESAEADRAAWGTGVTVVSGFDFFGKQITFSNGRSDTVSMASNTGTNLAGKSTSAKPNINIYPGPLLTLGTPAGADIPGTAGRPGVPAHFTAVPVDLDWVDSVVRILADNLTAVYTIPTAVAKWDTLFADAQADCEVLRTVDTELQATSLRFLDRYKTTCDAILVEAGIVPKSDASGALSAASGCWQDDETKGYWWVDDSGVYMPAFTNTAYYSVRKDGDGNLVPTQEFGFVIGCGCEALLKVGDRFSISLNGAALGGDTVRRVGDTLQLDIVGAGPLKLRGGADGSDTQTWSVQGSASGALPAWALPFAGGVDYTAAGVTARITQGGIPYELGDQFTLEIAAVQAQWRKNADAWSTAADLPPSGATLALGDGVSAAFLPGGPPSFVAGDLYSFDLEQPASASHVLAPDADVWQWAGADATMTASFATAQPVQAIAAVFRDLPDGAQVFAQTSADGTTWEAEQPMPRKGPIAVLTLQATQHVRALRLRLAQAEGAGVMWWWAGAPRTTDYAATVSLRRQWAATRGDALNPSSLYAGSGMGGEVAWDVLTDADLSRLLAMLDDNQQHGWPLLFLPHVLHPLDAALVRVDAGSIDLVDEFAWQPDQSARRVLRMTLPLQAVYQ